MVLSEDFQMEFIDHGKIGMSSPVGIREEVICFPFWVFVKTLFISFPFFKVVIEFFENTTFRILNELIGLINQLISNNFEPNKMFESSLVFWYFELKILQIDCPSYLLETFC